MGFVSDFMDLGVDKYPVTYGSLDVVNDGKECWETFFLFWPYPYFIQFYKQSLKVDNYTELLLSVI